MAIEEYKFYHSVPFSKLVYITDASRKENAYLTSGDYMSRSHKLNYNGTRCTDKCIVHVYCFA